MNKRLVIFLLLLLSASSNVFSHDAWIERKDGQFIVVYGHGSTKETYDTEKVKEVRAYDTDGKTVQVKVKKEGYPVVITTHGNASLIFLYFDNGFWSKTPDGYKNKPKKDVPDAMETSHSIKYSKAILRWSDKFSRPLGVRMEIVPLKNPLLLKAGDVLPVKVFLDGKPLEGASVNAGGYHTDDLKTDKNGIAHVRIERPGHQIITAKTKIPLKDNPNADILSLSASITFEVK